MVNSLLLHSRFFDSDAVHDRRLQAYTSHTHLCYDLFLLFSTGALYDIHSIYLSPFAYTFSTRLFSSRLE